jgi:hypothetical protein
MSGVKDTSAPPTSIPIPAENTTIEQIRSIFVFRITVVKKIATLGSIFIWFFYSLEYPAHYPRVPTVYAGWGFHCDLYI